MNAVKQRIVTTKSKEFLSLEGLLSIVHVAKDNLNPENFTTKMSRCLRLLWGAEWPMKQ
jgi:predicted ATP-dependent endonuclease of OLD family